jgi:hypothetical protein
LVWKESSEKARQKRIPLAGTSYQENEFRYPISELFDSNLFRGGCTHRCQGSYLFHSGREKPDLTSLVAPSRVTFLDSHLLQPIL